MARKWWTLLAVCIATFMLLLDITVVNVALPSIQDSLNTSFSDLQWVVDAYALTLAALLLTAGSLADLFGRRLLFVIGLVIFTLASLGCGLAHDPNQLIAARAVQGVGGAVMFSTSLALLAQSFSGRERGTAFGIWGAVTGLAVAVGPLVGGALTTWAGWEWIFFVNIPIGAVAVLLTLARVDESRDPEASRVDWIGVITFSSALFLLVYALIRGEYLGWSSDRIVGMLVGSAVLLVVFVIAEWKQRRPMLDLTLFQNPTFVGASLVAFCLSASMFAMFLYITLYIQLRLNYGALQAGLRFLPISLLSFVAAAISGNLTTRIPVRFLHFSGMALTALGLLWMSQVTVRSGWTDLLPGFILGGIGIGLTNPAIASTAIGVVHPARSGMASGINSTFRQVGIATGIAGLGAIFQHVVSSHIVSGLANTQLASQSHSIAHKVVTSQTGQGSRSHGIVAAAISHGFIHGFDTILMVSAAIAAVGAIGGLVLVRGKDFVQYGPPQPES